MTAEEKVAAIYRAAGRRIKDALRRLDAATYSDVLASEVRGDVKAIVSGLNTQADKWARESIPVSYRRSASRARTALEILGRKRRRPHLIDSGAVLADTTRNFFLAANASIIGTVDAYLAVMASAARSATAVSASIREFSFSDAEVDVARMAAQAVADESSRGELQAKLRRYLETMVEDDEFIEINGRMYRMTKYAELVARTTLREAATGATLDLCHEYENDLVEVSDHDTDCDICEEFEGNIYSISGNNPDYPKLEEEPPYHPNCKHSLLPTSDVAIEARREYGPYGGPEERI